jgi:adenine-specific DNA-methyltransferase
MELSYPGKKPEREILDTTAPCALSGNITNANMLIKGDNLAVLQTLRNAGFAAKVDLIYIDPPFATNVVFTIGAGKASTVSAAHGGTVAYADTLRGSAFVEYIRERLILARELLSSGGSLYLHSDYKIGHYLKVVMDEVFGAERFRNDIARIKCNPKNFSRTGYGNVKDMILFYTKTDAPIWHEVRAPFTADEKAALFRKRDKAGRAYTTTPLHAPGVTVSGATAGAWRGITPPVGRHWRMPPAELDALDAAGLIEWSPTGNPRKILYADEQNGKKLQDIWNFKDSQHPAYPTEKNLEMVKTIIRASSDEGSIVLDFFCGSGTTLVAAGALGRRWIGVDASGQAIAVAKTRLGDVDYDFLEQL